MARFLAAFTLATFAVIPATANASWEYVKEPPVVEAEPWQRVPPKRESRYRRSFALYVGVGPSCNGEPTPKINHVQVVERPNPSRWGPSAVVTVYVLRTPVKAVFTPTVPGEPMPPLAECAGIVQHLNTRVKLKRPVSRLTLFDGSRRELFSSSQPRGLTA